MDYGQMTQFLVDDDDISQFDLENLCNDDDAGSNKETTGRWTREEHLLFIKGLELYGKGWKKIAGLIKTRTVVQIRTHAQKYFLKLTKARQNGDLGSLSMDGKALGPTRKKKHRRRQSENLSLAPPLIPFVKKPAIGGDEAIDVDDGLYNFLSPKLPIQAFPHVHSAPQLSLPPFMPPDFDVVHHSASSSSFDFTRHTSMSDDGEESSTLGAATSDPFSALHTKSPPLPPIPVVGEKPEWFQRGHNVDQLLQEAENLNWFNDTGSVCRDDDNDPLLVDTQRMGPRSSSSSSFPPRDGDEQGGGDGARPSSRASNDFPSGDGTDPSTSSAAGAGGRGATRPCIDGPPSSSSSTGLHSNGSMTFRPDIIKAEHGLSQDTVDSDMFAFVSSTQSMSMSYQMPFPQYQQLPPQTMNHGVVMKRESWDPTQPQEKQNYSNGQGQVAGTGTGVRANRSSRARGGGSDKGLKATSRQGGGASGSRNKANQQQQQQQQQQEQQQQQFFLMDFSGNLSHVPMGDFAPPQQHQQQQQPQQLQDQPFMGSQAYSPYLEHSTGFDSQYRAAMGIAPPHSLSPTHALDSSGSFQMQYPPPHHQHQSYFQSQMPYPPFAPIMHDPHSYDSRFHHPAPLPHPQDTLAQPGDPTPLAPLQFWALGATDAAGGHEMAYANLAEPWPRYTGVGDGISASGSYLDGPDIDGAGHMHTHHVGVDAHPLHVHPSAHALSSTFHAAAAHALADTHFAFAAQQSAVDQQNPFSQYPSGTTLLQDVTGSGEAGGSGGPPQGVSTARGSRGVSPDNSTCMSVSASMSSSPHPRPHARAMDRDYDNARAMDRDYDNVAGTSGDDGNIGLSLDEVESASSQRGWRHGMHTQVAPVQQQQQQQQLFESNKRQQHQGQQRETAFFQSLHSAHQQQQQHQQYHYSHHHDQLQQQHQLGSGEMDSQVQGSNYWSDGGGRIDVGGDTAFTKLQQQQYPSSSVGSYWDGESPSLGLKESVFVDLSGGGTPATSHGDESSFESVDSSRCRRHAAGHLVSAEDQRQVAES